MQHTSIINLGQPLDDVALATFYGAKGSGECTVNIVINSDGTLTAEPSAGCKGKVEVVKK